MFPYTKLWKDMVLPSNACFTICQYWSVYDNDYQAGLCQVGNKKCQAVNKSKKFTFRHCTTDGKFCSFILNDSYHTLDIIFETVYCSWNIVDFRVSS